MSATMHLLGFMMHTPINHMTMSWTDPSDDRVAAMGSMKHWQDLARTLERGCFDGVFFADVPAVYDQYRDSTDVAVRYGVSWPTHDPVALVAVMTAATEHLGVAPTMSVAGLHPFLLVRTISTLDYLSGGRAGWNVVTGNARAEHRALGIEVMDHDERYARAEEYMQVCYKLWDAIDPDAILLDRANGVFADPARIRKVDHVGTYFRCKATPSVLPSPAGRPVIFQAGTSGPGQAFAVGHADVIFSIQPDIPRMIAFMDQIRATAGRLGRTDPVRVTFALQPFVGSTEEEARRRREELIAKIPLEAALTRMSGTLGIDLDKIDLDQPLQESDTQASRGLMKALATMMGETRMTMREAVVRSGSGGLIPHIVGTPEQIADQLEEIWRATGCLGFNLTPAINPSGLEDIVEHVVPILQKRGIFRREYAARTFRGNLTA